MDKRLLVLPVAAAVIIAACVWKTTRVYPPQPRAEDLVFPEPAPSFALVDQTSRQFRFDAYRGRHEIFLVFYDAQAGVAQSAELNLLKAHKDLLEHKGCKVFGISTALPQENIGVTKIADRDGQRTQSRNTYPFLLLTDLDLSVHRAFGRVDASGEKPVPGTFFIDRAGQVGYRRGNPVPLEHPLEFIEDYLGVTRES